MPLPMRTQLLLRPSLSKVSQLKQASYLLSAFNFLSEAEGVDYTSLRTKAAESRKQFITEM